MGARDLSIIFQSDKQDWATPWAFYRWLNAAFRGGFTIDVAADAGNHKHRRYFDAARDGLAQSWAGETWFCNPEYEKMALWTAKARYEAEHGAPGALLVTAKPDTAWWRDLVTRPCGALRTSYYVPATGVWWLRWAGLRVGVYFHDQRLEFDDGAPPDRRKDAGKGKGEPNTAPFPSAVILCLPNGYRAAPDLKAKHAYLGDRPPLTLGAPA